MQLNDVKIVNEVRHVIDIYIRDHQAGMPRGQAWPTLRVTAEGQTEPTEVAAITSDNGKRQDREDITDKEGHWNGRGCVNASYKRQR